MLEKKIRKNLLQEKEIRKRKLIETRLVKNRLSVIVESRGNFSSLSKKQQNAVFLEVMAEVRKLDEQGLINEGLGDILTSLFGQSWSAIAQSFVEPMVEKILGWFDIKGPFAKFLSSFIASKPQRLAKALTDCRELTKLIAESISETLVKTMQENRGMDGTGWNIIRNVLGGAMKDTSFIQSLENQMADGVCELFSGFTKKAENVLNNVKGQTAVAS